MMGRWNPFKKLYAFLARTIGGRNLPQGPRKVSPNLPNSQAELWIDKVPFILETINEQCRHPPGEAPLARNMPDETLKPKRKSPANSVSSLGFFGCGSRI
jgi:hypothetical protein